MVVNLSNIKLINSSLLACILASRYYSIFFLKNYKQFRGLPLLREKEKCDGTHDPTLEDTCGRPLGLRFYKATGDLYIVDAYFGLLMVGGHGGLATQLATSAEGVPFRFTNAVDIDQTSGFVYFTDSSTGFQRRFSLYLSCILSLSYFYMCGKIAS